MCGLLSGMTVGMVVVMMMMMMMMLLLLLLLLVGKETIRARGL